MSSSKPLGFPRIDLRRQLKGATEAYGKGSIDASSRLAAKGKTGGASVHKCRCYGSARFEFDAAEALLVEN